MAESSTVSQDNVVCRFFLTNSCRDGDNCAFSHDTTRTVPDSVCRFYLQGICRFGDRCRFLHSLVKNGANSKNTRTDKNAAGPSRTNSDNRQNEKHSAGKHGRKNNSNRIKFINFQRSSQEKAANAVGPGSPNWVNAPEFVPKAPRSYADALKASNEFLDPESQKLPSSEFCPYFITGECPFEPDCIFIHGDLCELCGKACLHPFDEEQRRVHNEFCEKEIEQDMELSFAIQRSIDKTCGICMDIIMEKEPMSERRFGILEKCNHVFCISCIRTWRRAKQLENTQHIDSVLDTGVIRSCPECRVSSDFVTPSLFWVDTEEEKAKLIKDYKEALSKIPCKHFKQGEGECPFGGACFYLHAKPDGTKVNLPLPTRRRRQNQDGDIDYMNRIFLWDYMEFREDNNILMHVELDDFNYSWSESEEESSDVSESFVFDDPFGLRYI